MATDPGPATAAPDVTPGGEGRYVGLGNVTPPDTAARHWHLIGRHVHPHWHGHCDPAKRGYKRCDRPHWHFLWRHAHAD